MKICAKCGEEKSVKCFQISNHHTGGYFPWCKECRREYGRENYLANSEYHIKRSKEYRDAHKEELKTKRRIYMEKNKEPLLEYRRKYTKKNRAKINIHQNKRRHTNIAIRLHHNMQVAIRRGLLLKKDRKQRWNDILGYDTEVLRKHLEKKFQNGMSWDNYGDWHVDHVIPVSVFNFTKTTDIDFKRAWALSNLQPLWSNLNYRKSAKLTKHFQPNFAF